MRQENMTLVSKRVLAKDVVELVLKGEMVGEMTQAGQFVDIKVPRQDLLLRRPISLCAIDQTNSQVTLIIRAGGEGTVSILDQKIGETLDVIGPLGHGFPTDFLKPKQSALLIGGGIGIPPLYELAKRLTQSQVEITILLGFQSAQNVFYVQEFSQFGQVHVATDDGSLGTFGTVETLLNEKLKDHSFDAVYACGPKGLNRMVNTRYHDHPHAYVSLEERMACGVGSCAACVCQKADKPEENLKVCDDGPVFQTGEVKL